jgi:hypothetical protein
MNVLVSIDKADFKTGERISTVQDSVNIRRALPCGQFKPKSEIMTAFGATRFSSGADRDSVSCVG